MTNIDRLKKLQEEIDHFVSERDWSKFHSPKSLSMSLAIEVAELMEIFQWSSNQESYSPDDRDHLAEEIGDVMIYLTTLAAKFDIDPIEAALEKMELNRKKYPAARVRGKATKYDKY